MLNTKILTARDIHYTYFKIAECKTETIRKRLLMRACEDNKTIAYSVIINTDYDNNTQHFYIDLQEALAEYNKYV